jgi:hypothetical protein
MHANETTESLVDTRSIVSLSQLKIELLNGNGD